MDGTGTGTGSATTQTANVCAGAGGDGNHQGYTRIKRNPFAVYPGYPCFEVLPHGMQIGQRKNYKFGNGKHSRRRTDGDKKKDNIVNRAVNILNTLFIRVATEILNSTLQVG